MNPNRKNAELVATSNGVDYSIKFQKEKEWQVFKGKSSNTYIPPGYYMANHSKVLRLACKLLIGSKWPAFIQRPDLLMNAVKALKTEKK